MRLLIQRVKHASVTIDGKVRSRIGAGLLALVGVGNDDGAEDIEYLAGKLVRLRIFDDEAGVMNLDVVQTGGEVLVVSQFTLQASTRKGNRRAISMRLPKPFRALFMSVLRPCRGAAGTGGRHGPVRGRHAGRAAQRRPGDDLDGFETQRINATLMKKIFALLFAALSVAFFACGDEKTDNGNDWFLTPAASADGTTVELTLPHALRRRGAGGARRGIRLRGADRRIARRIRRLQGRHGRWQPPVGPGERSPAPDDLYFLRLLPSCRPDVSGVLRLRSTPARKAIPIRTPTPIRTLIPIRIPG